MRAKVKKTTVKLDTIGALKQALEGVKDPRHKALILLNAVHGRFLPKLVEYLTLLIFLKLENDFSNKVTIKKWIQKTLTGIPEGNKKENLFERVNKILIREVLHLTRGNRTQAADWLGIARPTLQKKIKNYKIGNPFKAKKISKVVKSGDKGLKSGVGKRRTNQRGRKIIRPDKGSEGFEI